MVFDTGAYLRRIGLSSPPSVTAAGLAGLQLAHLQCVTFENLDVAMGRGVSLDPAHLFDKVVGKRRGGYCFELNALYGELLAATGFRVRPLIARVWLRSTGEAPPQTHRINLVEIDGQNWISDVAFGGGNARVPMPLDPEVVCSDLEGDLRLVLRPPFGFMFQRRVGTDWADQYSFTLAEVFPADFMVSNHYSSTHTAAHFTHLRSLSRFTPDGRVGLVDRDLTIRRGGDIEHRSLETRAEWLGVLKEHFGMTLDASADELDTLFAFEGGELT